MNPNGIELKCSICTEPCMAPDLLCNNPKCVAKWRAKQKRNPKASRPKRHAAVDSSDDLFSTMGQDAK